MALIRLICSSTVKEHYESAELESILESAVRYNGAQSTLQSRVRAPIAARSHCGARTTASWARRSGSKPARQSS